MANGRRLVNPPTFTPRPYNLWSVVQDRSADPDAHWRMGVTYDAWCPTASTTYDPCVAVSGVSGVGALPPPPAPAKAATTDHTLRSATPFTVYERIDCSSPGFWGDATAIATDMLTRSEIRQVETAFWTGLTAGQTTAYPHLAAAIQLSQDGAVLQTAAQILDSTPVDIVEAIARLESALATCYDGVGVIHIPAAVLPLMAAYTLVERAGAQLRTTGGTLVAVGGGYPGTSPFGTAPAVGAAWIYATGAVFGYRSGIETYQPVEAFNRTVNTVQMIAERTYLLGWDCCHHAIQVSLGGVVGGTFGAIT